MILQEQIIEKEFELSKNFELRNNPFASFWHYFMAYLDSFAIVSLHYDVFGDTSFKIFQENYYEILKKLNMLGDYFESRRKDSESFKELVKECNEDSGIILMALELVGKQKEKLGEGKGDLYKDGMVCISEYDVPEGY